MSPMSNNSSENLQNFQHILWLFGRQAKTWHGLKSYGRHVETHLQPVQNIDQIWYMAENLRGHSQDHMWTGSEQVLEIHRYHISG